MPAPLRPRKLSGSDGLATLSLRVSRYTLFALLLVLVGREAGRGGRVRDQASRRSPRLRFRGGASLLFAPFHDFDPGVGFRGTLELVDNGFISSINNSVGLGFGVDWTKKRTWIPIVMQWNFWLSRNWSVFGEPGVVLRIEDGVKFEGGKGPDKLDPFAFYAGGRLHFRTTSRSRCGSDVRLRASASRYCSRFALRQLRLAGCRRLPPSRARAVRLEYAES